MTRSWAAPVRWKPQAGLWGTMPSPLWALSPPLPHPPGRSLLMPFEDRGDLEPLELVWAKCRGYPSYPALVSLPQTTPSCSLSPWRLWPLPGLGGLSPWRLWPLPGLGIM